MSTDGNTFVIFSSILIVLLAQLHPTSSTLAFYAYPWRAFDWFAARQRYFFAKIIDRDASRQNEKKTASQIFFS
jgi:hypothetical protein